MPPRKRPPPVQRPLRKGVPSRDQLAHLPTPTPTCPSILERFTVRVAGRDYWERMTRLAEFVEQQGLGFDTDEDMELALLSWMDHSFLEGLPAAEGSKMWAAFMHFFPRYGKCGHLSLPRVPRALQGWHQLVPVAVRFPLFEEAVSGILVGLLIAALTAPRLLDALLMTALGADAYLRPGEVVSLTTASIIRAAPRVHADYRYTGILPAPTDQGLPTKVGNYDESILLNSPTRSWLGPLLEAAATARETDSKHTRYPPLFRLSYAECDNAFRSASRRTGLHPLRPVLYMLRHTGASCDMLHRRRPPAEIKRRGRWNSDMTLKRYEKHARAQAQLHRVSPMTLSYLRRCHDQLGYWLENPHLAEHPPPSCNG